jgi:hypothetical protein
MYTFCDRLIQATHCWQEHERIELNYYGVPPQPENSGANADRTIHRSRPTDSEVMHLGCLIGRSIPATTKGGRDNSSAPRALNTLDSSPRHIHGSHQSYGKNGTVKVKGKVIPVLN